MEMVKVGRTELLRYSKDRWCPKCGGQDISTRYHSKESAMDICWCSGIDMQEHMHRYCRNCHYEWLEASLSTAVDHKDEILKRAKDTLYAKS